MPYLRTEWAVSYPHMAEPLEYPSALIAREASERWNDMMLEVGVVATSRVVQRQISDWGDDE